ncbi:hypothetical protein [uncultured Metabacillus sp.]|uniref:hypothetical protein n=1 Tax=uncultured Metabacillus sp. TaxID=2860135 RepID=UPI002632914A|nr:hypothetical protein [uncultured Metabacillus sp.]
MDLDRDEVRKGIKGAVKDMEFEKKYGVSWSFIYFIMAEVFVVSFFSSATFFDYSWTAVFIMFFIGMVLYWLPVVQVIFLVLLSVLWGVLVWSFTGHIFGSLFVFGVALAIHLMAKPKV